MPVMPLPPHRRVPVRRLVARCRELLALGGLQARVFAVSPDTVGLPRQCQTRVPYLVAPLSGRMMVDEGHERQPFAPGTAAFFCAQSMACLTLDDDSRILRATWDADLLFLAEAQRLPGRRASPSVGEFIEGCQLPGVASPLAEQLLARLEAMHGGDERALGALVEALVVTVMDRAEEEGRDQPRAPERWQQALNWMRRNQASPITRQRAAETIGVHPNHLSRMLRRHCDAGFGELLRRMRLERAEELLCGTDLDLTSVARACGFSDRSHLTRVFKASHGTTPTAWREEAGEA